MSEYLENLKSSGKSPIQIGTHDGFFHCDEVLGTYLLQLLLPNSKVVRTRDPSVLRRCDLVIDVGGEYAPSRGLFDHHQRGFEESVSSVLPGKPWTTKLSSAGLIYCHFGKEILQAVLGECVSKKKLDAIFDRIYFEFVREIDAIDNGIDICEKEPKFIMGTHISNRVSLMNKPWNVKSFDETGAFCRAQRAVGMEFEERVRRAANVWWPAREIVIRSIANRYSVDPSGQIVELERYCQWMEHITGLERELNVTTALQYVVTGSRNSWTIHAVPVYPGSFATRLPLPSAWRGLENEKLTQVVGIPGCIFVHSSGHLGRTQTRQGAIRMAVKSMELANLQVLDQDPALNQDPVQDQDPVPGQENKHLINM